MDTRDLDRLVSKTDLSPMVKLALRRVRRAIEAGDVSGLTVSKRSWSIRVADPNGLNCTWTFYLKDENGNDEKD